ncbi:MAG: hypothetical protein ACOYEW_05490 [Anaerolineae bacterium]
MIVDGLFSISDFLGDLIVYRNLEPMNPALPRLEESTRALGLPAGRIPRKTEMDYARVVAHIAMQAAALRGTGPITRVLSVGDTRLNDGTAFANLRAATGWDGAAFICSEKLGAEPSLEEAEPGLFLANRWSHLAAFHQALGQRGLTPDGSTLAIVDLDKTAIGARGRNDRVIDEARIAGVRAIAADLLGAQYDEERFLAAYHRLNQPEYHVFTADNQDYLVYICLAIGAGLRTLDDVIQGVRDGSLASFAQFVEWVDANRALLAGTPLAQVHDSVYCRFRAGDPTPFKEFRYQEFRATIARLGCLPGTPSAEEALKSEIVLTREVTELVQLWKDAGTLVIGVSDKPDEAALPTTQAAEEGLAALHEARTHRVGVSIF